MQNNQETLIKEQAKLKESNSSLSKSVTTLQIVMENNSKRDEEERLKNAKKFDDLFTSRNKTNEAITELTTTIKMMVGNFDNQFKNLEKMISDLRKE